jgi:hypothetical protein
MSKILVLMLCTLLALSSLAMFGYVSAQSIPTPSVPEFILEFVDNSYDVPPTYEIDPYTGENITHPGYHVERITLEMKIKNQPFVSYYDADSGWNISFYYDIRIKGFYSEDWIGLYYASDGYPTQSDSDYTVISLGTLGETGLSLVTNARMIDVPSGGQVDFQVEAMIGYVSRVYNPNATNQLTMFPWQFTGEKSGWSAPQTLTIEEFQTLYPEPTPTLEPTSTPSEETTPLPTINTGPSTYYFDDFLIGGIGGIAATVVIVVIILLYCLTKRNR